VASSGKATEPHQCSQNIQFAAKNRALCAKERIAVLRQSRSNPQLLINSDNKIYGACRQRPHFIARHAKQTTPSTDESTNDESISPTCEVTTDFARCNVCLADVWQEALWGPTKRNCFLLVPRALTFETIPTICYKLVALCCLAQLLTIVKWWSSV